MPSQPMSLHPFDDLLSSEKEYLGDLKTLLQRVSAGWTQDDLPPKEVDTMLRIIEDIHALNRRLSRKLSDIQASQDITMDLSNILMWFADSMQAPYSDYCRHHVPLLDNWPEILHNARLHNILKEIAAEQFQHTTLDTFLMKPIDRLHYYRRLYMRQLESTERGRPDFHGMEAAFKQVDSILRLVTVDVPGTSRHPASPALSGISSMTALRQALPSPPISDKTSPNFPPRSRPMDQPRSPALPPSPLSPGMSPRHQPPHNAMMELEQSLDTSRVLDLFTMQPKTCVLSLALIDRSVLLRGDFCLSISPDQAGESVFKDGHVLLLSDLLLICRVKTRAEMDCNPPGDFSCFWLLFPPLAVRHVVAQNGSLNDRELVLELTIVGRVKARIWMHDEQSLYTWVDEANAAQKRDSAKAAQTQGQQLNRSQTQVRPNKPVMPGSPLSPTFQGDPHQRPFHGPGPGPGPMPMRPRPPMQAMGGMPSPGFRPMGGPMMQPGRPGMMQGQPARPFGRAMSMRRANTMNGRPGAPRGRIVRKGDEASAKEVLYKSKPCDVFQWRDDVWEPLVDEDDCYVELRLTITNRLCMAVTTLDGGQLVLNAWIVQSTTFQRSSATDVSVSMDMGASVQWFLAALNTVREADDFCMAFQRTKERAMFDPNVQKSIAPVLSRGDSLASTVSQQSAKREKVVKQTLTSMYPPVECKLFLQAGDHGQWMNLGSARCEVRMEKPSGHVRLYVGLISGPKVVLDSVIVQCDCLEPVGPKKLAITLLNAQEKMSIVYMLQFRDEIMSTKIFEALSLNENE